MDSTRCWICQGGVQYIAVLHQKSSIILLSEDRTGHWINETLTAMFLNPSDMECYLLLKCPFECELEATVACCWLHHVQCSVNEMCFWYSSVDVKSLNVCQGNIATPPHYLRHLVLFSPNRLHGPLCCIQLTLDVESWHEFIFDLRAFELQSEKKHGCLQIDFLLTTS